MSKDDRSVLSWLGFAAAIAALAVAIFGLRDDGGGGSSSAAGSEGSSASRPYITIVMNDSYRFTPDTIVIPTAGATLHLVNEGGAVHNMAIPELGLTSETLPGGTMYDWELTNLPGGTYTFICPQPGHEALGMKGTMTVSDTETPTPDERDSVIDTGEESGGTGLSNHSTSWDEMDNIMYKQAQLYPAKTEGIGNQPLEYTMDGDVKVFEVTAKVVDWEVEPGKIVKAWTYNGVVPGPEIKVYSGDKVRIIFKNELPDSTSLHFHGIDVPNLMDGVDPYTEDPTVPGETKVYEFVARGPAVGIYHSHHNAEQQIPDGMFAAFIIDDIPIPQYLIDKGYPDHATKTINMVLNDAGVIGLSLNGKSFPATEPYTIRQGEILLVHYMNEGLMAHPMHMHQPMGWVIARDGHILDAPYPTDTINVAPGERYTVAYMGMEPGVWAWHCHILTHADTPDGMKYMVTALIVERGTLSDLFLEQNPSWALPQFES